MSKDLLYFIKNVTARTRKSKREIVFQIHFKHTNFKYIAYTEIVPFIREGFSNVFAPTEFENQY